MSEVRLRERMRRLTAAEGRPPSFESVMAGRRRRGRLRVGRAAFAVAALLAVLFVAPHRKPDPPPKLAALTLPPTTDWLLNTPPATWLTKVPEKENSNGT